MAKQTRKRPTGKPFTKGDPRAGRPRGRKNNATIEVKDAARKLVEDPEYRQRLALRIRVGDAPHMETLLWHYAYGKPVDKVEMTGKDGEALETAVHVYMPANGR